MTLSKVHQLLICVLYGALILLSWAGAVSLTDHRTGPTIGGTPIPHSLHCKEDEVPAFTGPDTIQCVHNENGTLQP